MIPLEKQIILDNLKKNCLVFDIETSAHYQDGREINIRTNYDDYIKYAKIKWFGAYSYKNNQQYYINCTKEPYLAINLLKTHTVLVGFNSEEFDYPILVNNGYTNLNQYYLNVDCMQILGTINTKNRKGYNYKNKAELMDYKLKKNSLEHMAEVMQLDFQKGKIDYTIFHKNNWTDLEIKEIKKYLSSDLMATKQMFDKLWQYWLPFTELLNEKFIKDLSWIRSSIASLTYKASCNVLGVEPTYSEKKSKSEEMGGNVIVPKYEEAKNVWYLDFQSLYPHIISMFNLPDEIKEEDINNYEKIWHENKLFKAKGYYNIKEHHKLSKYISEKLKERINLKEKEPKSSMIYTLKIFLNSLYGSFRSPIFEKIHTPNIGWDTCWLSQQIQQFTIEMLQSFGFETIYGDTDSCMIITKDEEKNNKEYLQDCLNQIIEIIKDNVPFSLDTFSIKIEHYLPYIMFPFSEQPVIDEETGKNKKIKNRLIKERKGRKKNYLYIYKNDDGILDIELIGLPIKKDNATSLGIKIYEEILKPKILETKSAKFPKKFMDDILTEHLKKEEIINLIAREFKVNPFNSYKLEGQLQAQISKEYFNGESGVIKLIKNKKIGKVGKGDLYCTIQEALENKLIANDLDLEKIYNELEPFVIFEKKVEIHKEHVKKLAKILSEDNNALNEITNRYINFKEIDITKYPKQKNILYPFKWPGNKKDLLPILQEVFKQSKCDSIYEAFAGSAVFSLNTEAKSYTICDLNEHVINLWKNIKKNNKELIKIITSYDLDKIKDNQDYYNKIRQEFNNLNDGIPKSALFHILLGSCTNNLARFNSKGKFNQTWGARNNKATLDQLNKLDQKLQSTQILLQSYDKTQIQDNTLLYLDPPYLLSNDCYTAKSWNEQEEEKFLDWLSTMNCQWALSNIISKDTRVNELLQSFGKKYNVYYLSKKYNAKVGGYVEKAKHQAQEVLITNFEVDL